MTGRRWLLVALAGLALLLVIGKVLAGVYADWTWYAALGALPLYRSRLMHLTALRGGAAIAAFILAFANLYAVRSSIVSLVLPRRLGNIEIGEAVPGRLLTGLVLAISVAIAILLALPQDDWTSLALARFGVPFNELDPYNDNDFGFYIYRLPFERSIYLWALVALLVVTAVVVFLYAVTPSLRWERGRLYLSTYVRRHFAVLAGLVLMLVAWSYRLERLSLLSSGSGAGGAFSAFDHRIAIPLLTGLALGCMVAALVVAWAEWHGYHRVTLAALTVLLVAGPGARATLPMLARWSSTDAETRSRERPYLRTRTLFTRRAFALDRLVDADSARIPPMTREAIARGVSSWDPSALARTAELEHRGQTVAALAWVPAPDGLAAATVLRVAPGQGPWTVATVDATTADERGRALPHLGDPPATAENAMPAVLIEPGAPGYAIVADSQGRLFAPSFASRLERFAQAWHLQNPRLLATDPSGPRPRIITRRDVRERLEALVPFFTIGPTLQAAVRGDSLYWFAELFSTSAEYPLSEPILFAGDVRHYARHAATAIVQAQSGRVTIVPDAAPDPVARSWMRRFPWLFVPRRALPSGLEALWPPDVDGATAQANALVRAGFAGDTTFPRKVATPDDALGGSEDAPIALYATQGDRGPLAASLGILDADDRMIGILVARGGESGRTEWRRAKVAVSWRDALEKLTAAAGGGGARAANRRGRIQILPGKDAPVFAQAFYSWPPDALPELTRVSVLEGTEVRSGATLSDALGVTRRAAPVGTGAFRAKVTELYELMSAAMRRGDWSAFGNAYSQLGRLLRGTP